jgi:hypothetical protein
MSDAPGNSEVCQAINDYRQGMATGDFHQFMQDVQRESPWAIPGQGAKGDGTSQERFHEYLTELNSELHRQGLLKPGYNITDLNYQNADNLPRVTIHDNGSNPNPAGPDVGRLMPGAADWYLGAKDGDLLTKMGQPPEKQAPPECQAPAPSV